jgi:hypothetical protein
LTTTVGAFERLVNRTACGSETFASGGSAGTIRTRVILAYWSAFTYVINALTCRTTLEGRITGWHIRTLGGGSSTDPGRTMIGEEEGAVS